MLRIAVCRECGLSDKKIHRALEKLAKKHPGAIEISKKGCLDACKTGPAVRVGKKLLAPARPKKLKRLVAKRLDRDRSD